MPIAAKLARWFFVFTVVAGVLSLANVGATVTVVAKGLFFVFAILALFFVAMFEPASEPSDRHRPGRDVS